MSRAAGPVASALRTALTALTALGVAAYLTAVVADGPWVRVTLGGIAALAIGVLTIRTLFTVLIPVTPHTRRLTRVIAALAPTILTTAAALVFVVVMFGARGASRGMVVEKILGSTRLAELLAPLPEWFMRIGHALGTGLTAVSEGEVPLAANGPVTALVVISAWTLYLLLDALTVPGRGNLVPLIAVVGATVGLWAVAVNPPLVAGALAAAGALGVLAVPAPGTARAAGAPASAGGLALRAMALAAAGALVMAGATTAARPMTAGQAPLPLGVALGVLDGDAVRLDSLVQVERNLLNQSDAVAYTYQDTLDPGLARTGVSLPDGTVTTVGELLAELQREPMRINTLNSFDGSQWSSTVTGTERNATGLLLGLGPTEQAGGAPETLPGATRTIDLAGLTGSTMPVPAVPYVMDSPGTQVNITTDAVTFPSGQTTLNVQIAASLLEPDLLASAGIGTPAQGSDPYLELPDLPHRADIEELTQQVTADAPTAYDQLSAIETYLRSSEFTYSTTVAPTQDGDAVWTFLTTKQGYCVQYSTAMLVMARTLGIPGRIAVGFTAGELEADGSRTVTGADAHAWPEFYFNGLGWIRFEPTPAVRTGEAPPWSQADDAVPPTPSPSASATPSSSPSSTPEPSSASPSASPTPSDASSAPTSASPSADASTSPSAPGSTGNAGLGTWLVVGGVLLLALAAALFAALWARRRQNPTVNRAWAAVVRAARRVGVKDAGQLTPRELAASIGPRLSADGAAALDELVGVVEQAWYARRGSAAPNNGTAGADDGPTDSGPTNNSGREADAQADGLAAWALAQRVVTALNPA